MYSLISQLSTRRLLSEQLPSLGVSLILAEMFYKFHSFTLECVTFLVTWYAVDACGAALRKAWKSRYDDSTEAIHG
jgi:hypothetical protein